MKNLTTAICIAFFLLIPCCTMRQGDFTLLSTKNVEISRVDLKRVDFVKNIEGIDGRWWILFIPLGNEPTLEEACDRCLERGNSGDFMTSAVVYHTSWSLLLFGYEAWTIKGDVGNSISHGSADIQNREEK